MRTRSIYLTRQHFVAMLLVAAAAHIVMGAAWMAAPSLQVNKVPVHVLNIKLGAGDPSGLTGLSPADNRQAMAANVAQQPVPVPPPHENARTASPKPAAPAAPEAPAQTQATSGGRQAAAEQGAANRVQHIASSGSATSAPLSPDARPSQYVRESSGDARGQGAGSALGNSVDPKAEVMQRYTQLISMWINRHKPILNNALQPGMRGNVVLRLRIDRRGNIHHFKLDKATGVPAVDAAAAEMVRTANPVPPMPSNYPGGNMFEFLIPVSYTFEQ